MFRAGDGNGMGQSLASQMGVDQRAHHPGLEKAYPGHEVFGTILHQERHHIALGDAPRHAAVNAFACDVGPISQIRWSRRGWLSQGAAGHQHPSAVQHVVDLGDVGLVHGRVGRGALRPENAKYADAVASGVHHAYGPIAIAIVRRILDKRLDLRSCDVRRSRRRLCPRRGSDKQQENSRDYFAHVMASPFFWS